MPRIGQNPLKWIEIGVKPNRITIVTIVHIPELSGFWKNSLEVLKLCFQSLYANTSHSFDLMVLDNGSCDEVKQFLLDYQKINKIQFLTFSKYNLRKLGGMNYLFGSAPGEIVSFVDSDVYFLEGWLDATLEILNTFPLAGMISAIPTVDKSKEYYNATFSGVELEKDIIMVQNDNIISDNYVNAHCLSIGKQQSDYIRNIGNRLDTKITKDGISAYVCAQDFQFTTTREVINQVFPFETATKDNYYDSIYSPVFESEIDKKGFWRLSTEKYLIHHIGNSLDNLDYELSLINNVFSTNKVLGERFDPEYSIIERIRLNKYVRNFLKFLYSKLYNLLYKN